MKTINNFLINQLSYKVYCDMDGCLTDFVLATNKLGFYKRKGETTINDIKMWSSIVRKGISFWSEMEWMKDGKELWKFIKRFEPIILSAKLYGNDASVKGKKIWIKKHLGMDVKSIICNRKEKANYANLNSILIDDKDKTIIEWKTKGGIGIHHKNTRKTIKQLKGILL